MRHLENGEEIVQETVRDTPKTYIYGIKAVRLYTEVGWKLKKISLNFNVLMRFQQFTLQNPRECGVLFCEYIR